MTDWFENKRLQTSNPTIYEILIDDVHLFNYRYHLFGVGLVYGILHNKKDENGPKKGFIQIFACPDHIKDLLKICYLILDDGSGTNIYDKMCAYADGGIIALNDIFKENKSITLSNLIRESEELWKDRVKDLNNINLKSD